MVKTTIFFLACMTAALMLFVGCERKVVIENETSEFTDCFVCHGDNDALDAQRAGYDAYAVNDVGSMLAHEAVVAGQIGFAFCTVDDKGVQCVTLAQVELYCRRESRTAHTDNAAFGHPPGNDRRFADERIEGIG